MFAYIIAFIIFRKITLFEFIYSGTGSRDDAPGIIVRMVLKIIPTILCTKSKIPLINPAIFPPSESDSVKFDKPGIGKFGKFGKFVNDDKSGKVTGKLLGTVTGTISSTASPALAKTSLAPGIGKALPTPFTKSPSPPADTNEIMAKKTQINTFISNLVNK